jgi:hypothetical protein
MTGRRQSIKPTTKLRLIYLAAGLAVAGICLLVNINRFEILRWLVDEHATYPGYPQLFSIYELVFTWVPWVILFFVLIARIKKGPQIKIGYYFLGTALPIVLLFGHLVLRPSFDNYMNQENFDAVVWRNSDEVSEDFMWPHKLRMVDSLIESNILDGLSREEVINLLGIPTSDFDPAYKIQDEIYYRLGPERGFMGIDSEWLLITFDDNEEVKKYWLRTD